jgi:uncharacterized protein (UPF0335 family)
MPKYRNRSNGETHEGMIDRESLGRYVARVLELEKERSEISEVINEVYAEAKEAGFVTKLLRQLVREQKMDPRVLEEHLAQMDAYRHALGQLTGTPLGTVAEQTYEKSLKKPRAHKALDAAKDHLESQDLSMLADGDNIVSFEETARIA